MPDSNGNGSVSFTVKELLGQLDTKLDRIDVKLDSKADAGRLILLEARTTALENATSAAEAISGYRKWVVGSVMAAVAALGSVGGIAIVHFH